MSASLRPWSYAAPSVTLNHNTESVVEIDSPWIVRGSSGKLAHWRESATKNCYELRQCVFSKLLIINKIQQIAGANEFEAILRKSRLGETEVHRIRLDQETLPSGLDLDHYSGVIVGGGPGCVSDPPEEKSPVEARIESAVMSLMPEITARDFPYLGCCYGIGILGAHLGGEISKARFGEDVGTSDCSLTSDGRNDPICAGIPAHFQAFVGHKEAVQNLPPGCAHLISSPNCPFQMIRHGENVYATQFHPEADSNGFEVRIKIYRHRGYFPPEEAENLIAMCRAAEVHAPELVLRNFAARYGHV